MIVAITGPDEEACEKLVDLIVARHGSIFTKVGWRAGFSAVAHSTSKKEHDKTPIGFLDMAVIEEIRNETTLDVWVVHLKVGDMDAFKKNIVGIDSRDAFIKAYYRSVRVDLANDAYEYQPKMADKDPFIEQSALEANYEAFMKLYSP